MNKKVSCFVTALLLSIFSSGCGDSVSRGTNSDMAISKFKNIINEFRNEGPVKQILTWEKQIMSPVMKLLKEIEESPDIINDKELLNKNLEQVRQWEKELNKYRVVKVNDEYLYFSKCFLKKLELKLEQLLKNEQSNQQDVRDFQDAKLAYENVRSVLFDKKELYQFDNKEKVKTGMSYEDVRSLMNMPGIKLPTIDIKYPSENIVKGYYEQYLWVKNDKALFVAFKDGSSNKIKYFDDHKKAEARRQNVNKEYGYNLPHLGEWFIKILEQKPWSNAICDILCLPEHQLIAYKIVDYDGSVHEYSSRIWIFGNGYFYGDFIDGQLSRWKTQCLINDFWNE